MNETDKTDLCKVLQVIDSQKTNRWQSKILPLLIVLAILSGCKSSRMVTTPPVVDAPRYLSSKMQLTIPNKGGSFTVSGTMKLKSDDRVQLSILMPILRTEMVRIDISPDEAILVDRMNRRFVRTTKEELREVLPKNSNFAQLQKLLFDASLPQGKSDLTGKELGIPSFEKAKAKLYDFSFSEFIMSPTEVSSKYTQVPLSVLVQMLMDL